MCMIALHISRGISLHFSEDESGDIMLDSRDYVNIDIVNAALINTTGCHKKKDTVTLFKTSSGDVMSTKFQTLCRKPRSIRMSSFEDMSDYVTEFKNTS